MNRSRHSETELIEHIPQLSLFILYFRAPPPLHEKIKQVV